jgi:carbamoyl-phosphate synthase large subunit
MKTKDKINVLVTGCGAPGGPGIIKCLMLDKRLSILVGDADTNASGRYIGADFLQLPLASQPEFADQMLTICKNRNIDIIFPLVTKELFQFSRHLQTFKSAGVKVIVSPIDGLEIANDKVALYTHLQKNSIEVPEFRVACNLKELKAAVLDMGYPSRPVVIKPGISNGSRGIRILDANNCLYDLLFNEKPNSLYSTLDYIERVVGSRDIPRMLVSEYLPGKELTVDTIISEGIVKTVLIRTRDKMNGGISVAGEFIKNKIVEDYCIKILSTMNVDGPIGIQLKESNNSTFKILEINPRIQGTSVAAMGLEINLPLLAVYEMMRLSVEYTSNTSGIGFVRFYDEAYYNIK